MIGLLMVCYYRFSFALSAGADNISVSGDKTLGTRLISAWREWVECPYGHVSHSFNSKIDDIEETIVTGTSLGFMIVIEVYKIYILNYYLTVL